MIAVSASAFEQERDEVLATGFDDFLPKPVQLDDLLAWLERRLDLDWELEDGAAVFEELRLGQGIKVVMRP